MLSFASQKKTYDPMNQSLLGGLGPLPSMASGAPGSQVASPTTIRPIVNTGLGTSSGWSVRQPSPISSPGYTIGGDIVAQRGVEAGREASRYELLAGSQAMAMPGSWQTAGYPAEHWDNERKAQEAALSRQIAARRAQLQARRRAGAIEAAEYDLEMSNLSAQHSSGLTSIRNSIASQRMQQGQAAATQSAQLGIAAAGAIPSDRMAPVETTLQSYKMGDTMSHGGREGKPTGLASIQQVAEQFGATSFGQWVRGGMQGRNNLDEDTQQMAIRMAKDKGLLT